MQHHPRLPDVDIPGDPDRPLVKLVALGGLAAVIAAVVLNVLWSEPVPPPVEWTFSDADVGADVAGFELPFLEGGRWTHEHDDAATDGRVLVNHAAQGVEGAALALARRITAARDLRVTTRCRAGDSDACGVVVRVRDTQHHYLVRLEPRTGRSVIAIVVGGVERELASAEVALTSGWHDLSVEAAGTRLRVEVDGQPVLDHTDGTLPRIGGAGLWSPASGSAAFDLLRIEPMASKDRS